MKGLHILTVILCALLLQSCSLVGAPKTNNHGIQSPPDKVVTDEPSVNDTKLTVYFENDDCYLTDHKDGYGLYSKTDRSLINLYTGFKTLNALSSGGAVREIMLATGDDESGKKVLYELSKSDGEKLLLTAKHSISFVGDFVLADWTLYTADLRPLGKTYALTPPTEPPSYSETVVFTDSRSDSEVRVYLTECTGGKPKLPLSDDATAYNALRPLGNGKYIGVFMDGDTVMSRYFAADPSYADADRVYIYEYTSPAILMGKIGEFERYRSTNMEYLVDSSGNFRLFTEGTIKAQNGFIEVEYFDQERPSTIYSNELELLADNVTASVKTVEGLTLISHSNRIYSSLPDGSSVAHDNYAVSLIGKDGTATRVSDADSVYALTDNAALIEKNGELLLVSAHSLTCGETLAVLEGWHSGLIYSGQMSDLASGYRFVFTDTSDTDKNYDPLRIEWCFTDTEGKVDRTEYYGSLPDGFCLQSTEH